MKTPRVLFVHNRMTKFVQMDLVLLRERYIVREWYQRSRLINVPALIKALVESDLVFGWFASWHSFIPLVLARTLNRPSVLVVGGYDTANIPAIGYGNQRGGFKGWVSRTTMNLATNLIVYSLFIRDEVLQNARVNPKRVALIYLGVPIPEQVNCKKENIVISTGDVNYENLSRKGLEVFVRAAALLPDIPFVLVGAWWPDNAIRYLRSIASPNVRFTNRIEDQQLYDYFGRARVYVQPSRHEGFGLSLAEAMLCACVPIVTRVGALPEVVGDTGIYLDAPDPISIADAVRCALALDDGWGRRAHDRIVQKFPLERRRVALYDLVDNITDL